MSITASEMTPADIRAVTDGNNGGYGGGWGGDWSAWIIIFLIFGFFGWGGNGWGGGFGGRGTGAGVVDGYVLASDFSNIERKIDGVNNGVCDGFYAMNTGMLNGFAGVNQNISNGFQAAELSRCNQQAALMQQLFQMQMANQECCCENRAAIQGVNYNLATQSCDTRNTIQNTTRWRRKIRKSPIRISSSLWRSWPLPRMPRISRSRAMWKTSSRTTIPARFPLIRCRIPTAATVTATAAGV